MHAFKRNTGLIFKTFLYQIVMSLFGFMMYGATYKIPFLMIIGQSIITVFFLFIMAHQMYQQGAKTCEHDISHSLTSSPLFGFVFAVIAFLPAILLSAATVFTPPFLGDGTPSQTYAPFLINKTFLQGMYMGIIQLIHPTSASDASSSLALANNAQCLLHLIGSVPGILSCGIGYLIGYKTFMQNKKKRKTN